MGKEIQIFDEMGQFETLQKEASSKTAGLGLQIKI